MTSSASSTFARGTWLETQLARVAAIHARRGENPIEAGALRQLAHWQARRLRRTYADLASQPRYAEAIRFFETELYCDADFARRDADFARVVPIMTRMLPAQLLDTLTYAVELNALSHELDAAVLAHLPRADGSYTVAEYCNAYRSAGRRADRERQIRLIRDVGAALDRQVQKAVVRAAVTMMRKPAHLAGFGALHDFLEHGFHAFRRMHGAHDFLTTVASRETMLLDRIFAGDDAPFPDPQVRLARAAP